MQTERRLPNRVEDSSPCSLPDLRRTGCSTVHHEAAASLIALCPATHLPVAYWPAASAPLFAPQMLQSECCRLALRSQQCNFPPVRRLALRSQRRHRSTPALRSGIFPVALPARPQSLFAHFIQSPGLPPALRIGILNGRGCTTTPATAHNSRGTHAQRQTVILHLQNGIPTFILIRPIPWE